MQTALVVYLISTLIIIIVLLVVILQMAAFKIGYFQQKFKHLNETGQLTKYQWKKINEVIKKDPFKP